MVDIIDDIGPESLARFDAVIDVRSPAEFAEDRLPGAINLPVLGDEERAEIGTAYVRASRFLARRKGAALIARNIAHHLETALADKPADWRPLVYCWRGGERSNAIATIFDRIGWRTGVLKGGYKTWRRAVVADLRASEAPLKLILIDGQTGAGKTEILAELAALGAQTLDLEALAAHRGSVFGAHPARAQPSQKLFESLIFSRLQNFDARKAILVEAESNHIGAVRIPARLWRAMRAAPGVEIYAGINQRAVYLVKAYKDILDAPDVILNAVDRLKRFHGKGLIEEWRSLAERHDFRALAASLMRAHYDPLYDRARDKRGATPVAVLKLDDISEGAFATAAQNIQAIIENS